MKRGTFVKTENMNRFLSGLSALESRGAEECNLMVVEGHPGLSKTHVTQWWSVQNNAIFIRAKAAWNEVWMMKDIIKSLNVTPVWSREKLFNQAIDTLCIRRDDALRSGQTFAIVIDEIDHIVRQKRMMEMLRDITDHLLVVPMIWVGMGQVRHNLKRYPQIASRVGQYVEFLPASFEDAHALVTELSEVPVADDLIEYLHQVSKGRVREIKEAIANIERVGRLDKGKEVTLATMRGQVLFNSRETAKAIKVEA